MGLCSVSLQVFDGHAMDSYLSSRQSTQACYSSVRRVCVRRDTRPIYAYQHARSEVTWGSADASKATSQFVSSPNPGVGRSALHSGIRQSMTYNGHKLLDGKAGVVDSGTTMLQWLHQDAYKKYVQLTSANYEPQTKSLGFTPAQYAALKPLVLHIGNGQVVLTPDVQIWPRWRSVAMGGRSDRVYSIIQALL